MDLLDNAGIACRSQTACPLCGGDGAPLHAGIEDRLFGSPGRWGFQRCTACRLMWLAPMPLPEALGQLYANYYTHNPGGGRKSPASWKTVAKAVLARVVFWRPHAFRSGLTYLEDLPPGRLLEVGCGSGAFLRAAAAAGWRAVGIDFDRRAIEEAQRIPGVDAQVGDLLDRAYPAGSFDAIVLNNVIEHLPDPAAVFRECARILGPGGRLVMVTPNPEALGHRLHGAAWRGLEVPRHLHLFSPPALRAFARAAGFARANAFSSAGGATGVQMLQASGASPDAARKTIRRESAWVLFGRDVGEWSVLVAHK